MKDVVCNYAILRFLPYRETGEFVNVGVVVYAPQKAFFDFRCETTFAGRVGAFFPDFDGEIYRRGLETMTSELERVQTILGNGRAVEKTELPMVLARFRELVRTREGMLHFGGQGSLLAPDPAMGLGQLYSQFVSRRALAASPSEMGTAEEKSALTANARTTSATAA